MKCKVEKSRKYKKDELKDRKMASITKGMKKGGKKVKAVAPVTPELAAEPVGTPETRGVSAFGFDAKELLTRLQNFRATRTNPESCRVSRSASAKVV